ncbi:MAG TPA: hypothetical protein VGO11_16780 [Chthoniobacteraceae bacterium]|jgi:hypothetical protein|nr:hypothetical protein [Chthoniobacteraceae bacterium]
MSSYRLAGIPMDHLQAEVAAFPLASEAALALGPLALSPHMAGETGSLWRRAEGMLVVRFPGFSLDELVAIRDQFWFDGGAPVPLHAYVRRLAEAFLVAQGAVATPRMPGAGEFLGWGEVAAVRRAWYWMSVSLPPDLLLGALGGAESFPGGVDLLSGPVAKHLLESGFAEMHLHIGAGLNFSQLWLLAMVRAGEPALKANAFATPGAELNGGADFAPWILRAALARRLIVEFLSTNSRHETFGDWLQRVALPETADRMGPGDALMLAGALEDLRRGRLGCPGWAYASLQSIYRQLRGPEAEERDLRSLPAINPDIDGTSELVLVKRVLDTLRLRNDPTLATLFWQMVRVRGLFYRHIVQRPMTRGLLWFVRFYGRSSPSRQNASMEKLLACAAELNGRGRGLRSLEIRTAPWAHGAQMRQMVDGLDAAARSWTLPPARGAMEWNGNPLELGLVFHFTKGRGGGAGEGVPKAHWRGSHADPCPGRENPNGLRYAHWFNEKRREARALSWLLTSFPLSLGIFRGVDVCTDELGVPTWVVKPLLEHVRRASRVASASLAQFCGRHLPPLHQTIHAGEDFVHLQTGLRNVDEVVEKLGLGEGDRIGHGVALGIDPADWAVRAGRLLVAREDRLADLVWEWAGYGSGACVAPPGRASYIEREIAVLSERMFDQARPPRELERLMLQLCNEWDLYAVGFPEAPRRGADAEPRTLLHRFLTDAKVFERGREQVWVDPAGEVETLRELQRCVRRKVAARRIAVEVNPTSNLLIGDLSDLRQHPLWRMRPPRGDGDAPGVPLCIGSDDPLVFASNLPQEYQFLCDALTLAGLSQEEMRQWIDSCRVCGLEHRFTLPATGRAPLASLNDSRGMGCSLLV